MPALHLPVLRTDRLALEPLSRAHSPRLFALWSQEPVCRHSGPAYDLQGDPIPLPVATPAHSDRILEFFLHRAAQGLGFRWAVIADDGFIGAVGFNHLTPRAELAWHFHPDHWGRGYATEAARAALDWLAAEGPVGEVEAFIEPANAASIRLGKRLGLQKATETERWVMASRSCA